MNIAIVATVRYEGSALVWLGSDYYDSVKWLADFMKNTYYDLIDVYREIDQGAFPAPSETWERDGTNLDGTPCWVEVK